MNKIPRHLGIILDGNRRWARERGLPVFEGHKKGLEKIYEVMVWCKKKGVETLTLFCFSTENWKRPKQEIDYLMQLLEKAVSNNLEKFSKEGIRLKVIGERRRLSDSIREAIVKTEEATKDNKEMILNLALSYGGRGEIVQAVKNIIDKGISADKVSEKLISENLWASDLDLIVRTGKEQRISNFLIWQAAYSEIHFFNKYWPDFSKEDLEEIFLDYAGRERRFGK